MVSIFTELGREDPMSFELGALSTMLGLSYNPLLAVPFHCRVEKYI